MTPLLASDWLNNAMSTLASEGTRGSALLMTLVLLSAWLVDRLYGEYHMRLHPVVWMGKMIELLRQAFLGRSPFIETCAGGLLLLSVTASFTFLCAASLHWLAPWPFLALPLAIFWLKSSFALRALGEAALHVHRLLDRGAIADARGELRALCSRDASELDARQLTEASISSLAENLSDSVIAPLFYFLIGGIPAAVAYRAVNTLDAMVGYKNHLRHLGWASARCDDLLNWIPARITALLLAGAGLLAQSPVLRAWHISWRDHGKTPSPNGGWPMAMMAGLLRIQLEKPGVYRLGDSLEASDAAALNSAWELTRTAAWLGLLLSLSVLLTRASL